MFVEKLNKKQDGIYVIEEEKIIIDGKWEGFLGHDNVNIVSISIHTAPGFAGKKVVNYFVSTLEEMPWKTHLKVFSDSEKVYITYESTGDQVEAEDINELQRGIVGTIKDLEEYKKSNIKEIDNLKEKTIEHIHQENNPHLVTLEQLGGVSANDINLLEETMKKYIDQKLSETSLKGPFTWQQLKGV
ncbi:hypothetical protein [Anaerophilus nitritogenes]|uniref:hypothetical protein n=1 Tax=Anaerophilus nitritogenes TaxID=2498136 RepID=UPI001930FAD8|nr:hypothetical protein [Anaerophilus nitritogenes]